MNSWLEFLMARAIESKCTLAEHEATAGAWDNSWRIGKWENMPRTYATTEVQVGDTEIMLILDDNNNVIDYEVH